MAHKIFDPIGFTCTVMICPKILLQKTWELKIGWSKMVPEDIADQFIFRVKQLPLLMDAKIPRWISMCDTTRKAGVYTPVAMQAKQPMLLLCS